MKEKNMNIKKLSEKSAKYIKEKIKSLDFLGKRFDFRISDKFDFNDKEFDTAFDNIKSEMLLQFILPKCKL
jgi:uncharacterized protein YllA (UPF0747 family)